MFASLYAGQVHGLAVLLGKVLHSAHLLLQAQKQAHLSEGIWLKVQRNPLGVILFVWKEMLFVLNWAILIPKHTCEPLDDMVIKDLGP